MKTRTALSWILLAGVLAGGAVQATPSDRDAGATYGNAPHIAWLQGDNPVNGVNSHLIRHSAKDRGDIQAYPASVRAGRQLVVLNIYALGCVIYFAFIFFLGLFVGFNELDRDK